MIHRLREINPSACPAISNVSLSALWQDARKKKKKSKEDPKLDMVNHAGVKHIL